MWSSPPPRNCRSCWACRCASTTVSKSTMSRRRCGRRYWMTSGDCSERGGWGSARPYSTARSPPPAMLARVSSRCVTCCSSSAGPADRPSTPLRGMCRGKAQSSRSMRNICLFVPRWSMPGDRYPEYYAAKLWQMLPGIYRSLDGGSVDPGRRGPLREIVNRIGAEAAVIRRSIDRMWEDQSIESCDDWIIPYIGDLLGTRLVACLDARAKRLDVAKTIYYRRRAGTVGLLEELASDIAGRDARVVEFFRHLGRTRHCFDPPIGLVPRPSLNGELSLAAPIDPAPLALIEGLSGAYTRTPMGGYADLRHHYGASRAKAAIDEYFYSADFRRGRQSLGWHNIPKLGVFIWWLPTYLVPPTTPVEYALCPNQFTFDPTGREIPLFCAPRRAGEKFGEAWTSPDEWELPAQISQPLFELRPDQLYADAQDVHAIAVLEGNT